MRAVVHKFHNFCLKSRHLPSIWSRIRSDLPKKSTENAAAASTANILVSDESASNKLELIRLEFELLKYLDPDGAPKELNDKVAARLCEEPILKNRILYMLKHDHLKFEPIREKRDQLSYNLHGNAIFLKFWASQMNKIYESRFLFKDRPIVSVDLSFTHHLDPDSFRRLIDQLLDAIHVNRKHRTPCKLLLTNMDENASCWAKLKLNKEKIVVLSVDSTEKSILELYSDRKMIYLSPKSAKPLLNFDEDVVYILGGLPSRHRDHGGSLDRAAALGIQTRCLPFDVHFQRWPTHTSRAVRLDQCLGVLLDYYQHKDWEKAITDRVFTRGKEQKSKHVTITGQYLDWLLFEFQRHF